MSPSQNTMHQILIEEKVTNNLAYVNLEDYHKFFTFILIYSPKIIGPIIAHSETCAIIGPIE